MRHRDEARARIDVRSASRFGSNDFGGNAERIRGLMKEIVTRLEATVPVAESEKPTADAKKAGADKRDRDSDPKSVYRRKSRVREQ